MSAPRGFYLERADECAKQAAESTLPNVRERCLRAEQSWRSMADLEARTEALRETTRAAKAVAEI